MPKKACKKSDINPPIICQKTTFPEKAINVHLFGGENQNDQMLEEKRKNLDYTETSEKKSKN